MSYCRWSSDDFKCDLYCYEDVSGGWTTHVAARKRKNLDQIPKLLQLNDETIADGSYMASRKAQGEWLETHGGAEHFEPIGGPCDGQAFNDDTLEDFHARLVSLREMGYNFPDYVLEGVAEEIVLERGG